MSGSIHQGSYALTPDKILDAVEVGGRRAKACLATRARNLARAPNGSSFAFGTRNRSESLRLRCEPARPGQRSARAQFAAVLGDIGDESQPR